MLCRSRQALHHRRRPDRDDVDRRRGRGDGRSRTLRRHETSWTLHSSASAVRWSCRSRPPRPSGSAVSAPTSWPGAASPWRCRFGARSSTRSTSSRIQGRLCDSSCTSAPGRMSGRSPRLSAVTARACDAPRWARSASRRPIRSGCSPVSDCARPAAGGRARSRARRDPDGGSRARGGGVRVAHHPAELERRPRAVAIGTFDGVHRGHRAVLDATLAAGGVPTAITFHPHPRVVLGYQVDLLCTIERRLELLAAAGIEETLVVEFTPEVATLEPAAFVDEYLEALGAEIVVAGEGFRFGRLSRGDLDTIRELGIAAQAVPILEGVSSTRIRTLAQAGDVGRGRGAARAAVRARRHRRHRRSARRDARVSRRRTCASRPSCWSRPSGSTRAPSATAAQRSRSASTRTTAARSGASRRSCSTGKATCTATGSSSSSGAGCATSGCSRARPSSSTRSPVTSPRRARSNDPSRRRANEHAAEASEARPREVERVAVVVAADDLEQRRPDRPRGHLDRLVAAAEADDQAAAAYPQPTRSSCRSRRRP